MKKKIRFTVIILVIVAAIGALSYRSHESKKVIQAADHMEDTVVTVDGKNLTMTDIMFYIAYEETSVQEQARVYAPNNPASYWNLHVDGQFMKVVARKASMNMAVHDEIFYQLALEEELELNKEEQTLLDSKESDFWSDLTEEEKAKMGVTEDVIKETLYHLTLAQKYQKLISEKNGITYEAYDVEGAAYQDILTQHEVKVNDWIWDRLSFGDIVINKQE